ncbi:octanoyltransferase [Dulcicalothrix desertica PCC 7102]|uniref:Octanoyltransferase n=1 Tax=Dulcicalothrix desertica PCC 7102 TaxID=232991 RepID=A0A433UN05_9CYAN|nr:lipoyl(octanoyl) transferase LipB [Dulcicalothrix desertica]RUS95212.1 octanoyltransferase [Dulcicalothrix desertica PCC 7102]TWH40701.1 lipoyl(octanoyl) transferase [Dulcicalothrix desertica PCC 7102]
MIFNNISTPYSCSLYNQDLMPYLEALAWQRALLQERINNPNLEDVLILVEHPPVYTLGQGANLEFLKFDPLDSKYEVHRIERGGEVTYHCPGQIVGYPILNLHRYQPDLHWYLRQLEEVLIIVLQEYGLVGARIPGLTGVWVEGRKVAAIGIKVKRWITMHGFSLNVNPDMTGFNNIVPCGIVDKPVASLAEWIPNISSDEVRLKIAHSFAQVFGVTLQPQETWFLQH